jgi:hypothetical protein
MLIVGQHVWYSYGASVYDFRGIDTLDESNHLLHKALDLYMARR